MTEARWQDFFRSMQSQGLYKADLDWHKAFTAQFVDKGVGLADAAALSLRCCGSNGAGEAVRQRDRRAGRRVAADRGGRLRRAARPVRLRQVHPAAPDRRARPAEQRADRLGRGARRHRLRVPGRDPAALGDGGGERAPAAAAARRDPAAIAGGSGRGARPGRPGRVRAGAAAAALRRHAHARLDRAQPGRARPSCC